MRNFRLALIGFGNVGQGFAQILTERGAAYEKEYRVEAPDRGGQRHAQGQPVQPGRA